MRLGIQWSHKVRKSDDSRKRGNIQVLAVPTHNPGQRPRFPEIHHEEVGPRVTNPQWVEFLEGGMDTGPWFVTTTIRNFPTLGPLVVRRGVAGRSQEASPRGPGPNREGTLNWSTRGRSSFSGRGRVEPSPVSPSLKALLPRWHGEP